MGGNCFGRVMVLSWVLLVSSMAFEVDGGGSVMEDLCSHTEENYFLMCMDCLKRKAMPQIQNNQHQEAAAGINVEVKELAGQLIECVRGTTNFSHKFMVDFCGNSTGIIHEASCFCVGWLKNTELDFIAALDYWKYGHTSTTIEKIKFAEGEFHECARQVPSEMPPETHQTLTLLRIQGQIAEDVITAISS